MTLNKSWVVLLYIATLLLQSPLTALAEVNGLSLYPHVCQIGLKAIDHKAESFSEIYGTPLAKESRKLTEPGYEGLIGTWVTFPNAVKHAYSTSIKTGISMNRRLTLGSGKAREIAGFNISAVGDIKKKFGSPHHQTQDALVYSCDNVDISFVTKGNSISAVDILVHDI